MEFGRSTEKRKTGAVLDLPEGMAGIRGARILLVDDNHLNQVVVHDFLNFARLTVDLAVNGKEAVRAVKAAAEPYDAVLMDVQMPVMDGLEATRIIRQDAANRDLPIIATSANTRDEEWERCLAVGINDWLPKPFLMPDLCAILTRWIPPGDRAPLESDINASGETVVATESASEREIVTEIHLPDLIDGIDTKVGLSRAVGNRKLYANLLTDFAEANEALAEEVRGAVETGDLERARFLVHGLKSTAGNIGAEDLLSTVATLEAELAAWKDRLARLLENFQGKLDGVVAAIRAAEIQVLTETRPAAHTPFNRDEARRHAETLGKMLENQHLGARQQLDRLVEILGGNGCDDSLERLAVSVEALDYTNAREILESVRKEFLQ